MPKTLVIEIINTERLEANRWFGETKTAEMIQTAQENYHALFTLFVQSGFKDVVYETFILPAV